MKAVRIHEDGGPEVLRYEDAPDPVPGTGQVLIELRAASLNHLDVWIRQGLPSVPKLLTAWEHGMIILGIVLLLIGFLAHIPILTTIGVILVVIGAILAVLGMAGREVGGRAHWY